MHYKLKYIDKNFIPLDTLPIHLGNLCHKIKELQMSSQDYTYEYLMQILEEGYVDESNPRESVMGLNSIKSKFYEEFYEVSSKSGLDYRQKIENFKENIKKDMKKDDWEILAVEQLFEFEYEDVIITGKIDRIDRNLNTNEIRVIDYKTSDKPFDEKELPTALQMYIYNLAIENIYGIFPTVNKYVFLFLDKEQYALTKGWESRGAKALSKLTEDMKGSYVSNEFVPKPSPLCAFCGFSGSGYVKNEATNGMCQYYSLWTREDKTFEVNKKYDPLTHDNNAPTKNNFVW